MATNTKHGAEGLNVDELPTLDPAELDDEETLAELVDALVLRLDHHDPEVRRLREELLLQQAVLRDVACESSWAAYLQVEQAATARAAELLLRLFRAGYACGVKAGSR